MAIWGAGRVSVIFCLGASFLLSVGAGVCYNISRWNIKRNSIEFANRVVGKCMPIATVEWGNPDVLRSGGEKEKRRLNTRLGV